MSASNLTICRDGGDVARRGAELICECAGESIAKRGRFTLALSGGSTPKKTYALLAAGAPSKIDWSKVYLFFGDERFVPHDDERSNYRMAHDSLLGPAKVLSDHVFAVSTNLAGAADCAREYERVLRAFFATPAEGMPEFDLILLGLGDDGHTASLFPGAAALHESRAAVTSSPPGVLPPPVERITLTYPVLNAARQVAFLVSGANKAEAVRDVLSGRSSAEQRPAAGVVPTSGALAWLVDRDAASLVPPAR